MKEKTAVELRKYIQGLSPNATPVLTCMAELLAFASLVDEVFKLAQPNLPSLCPLVVRIALAPDLYMVLEDETLARNANPRSKSSAANMQDLERMRERGIDLTDNPKGEMLLFRKGSIVVIKDGFHSLRSKVKHDNAEGVRTNYIVRVHFLTGAEAQYFDDHGDGHTAKRQTLIQTTLKNSKGDLLVGQAKKLQHFISKNLCSLSRSMYGMDFKAASDEINDMHAKYRTEIEFVCAQGKGKPPWLSSMDVGYHTKSFVLAVFIDAMIRFPKQSAAIDDFVVEYATRNYSSKNEYVAGLLSFLDKPPLAVVDTKAGSERASKGSRDQITIIVKGVAFWLYRYLHNEKAVLRGKPVVTDTSHYHLKLNASAGVPTTE